ncbi:MAG: hypothetical protein ACI85Q_000479 [Salibacteraceae bacterium]|jgi:hypothetical protein
MLQKKRGMSTTFDTRMEGKYLQVKTKFFRFTAKKDSLKEVFFDLSNV